MQYGDFSSLVQLGVGLHLGTALLQLYGEIGLQPMNRTLSRIRRAVECQMPRSENLERATNEIEADFEIFKVQFFNEYKYLVKINSTVAIILTLFLVMSSFFYNDECSAVLAIFVVALSVLPGPLTLWALWCNASAELRPLKNRADDFEKQVLGGS